MICSRNIFVGFLIFAIVHSALPQGIYEPSFTSEWYQAEAGNRNKSLLTIPHDLGEYPVKVDVQVKIFESGKEYIFSGIGSSQRDDDLIYDFGAVIYQYNDSHFQLGFPFNRNGPTVQKMGLAYTGSGTLYNGPSAPKGPYNNGLVRVRAWVVSDMPSPVINMSSYISRDDGENYRRLQHGLGFYPDIVTVRTLTADGYMSDGIGVVFVSNTSRYWIELGGVLFGYDDQHVTLWVPTAFYGNGTGSGGVFVAMDGYPFKRRHDGTANILGWKIVDWQQVFHFKQQIGEAQSHHSTVDITCSFNWANYLVSVQYQVPSGDGGMMFYGAGTAQAIPISRYGGIVYAYTKHEILLWNPLNTAAVYIGERWGGNRGSLESNVADVIMKIFYLEEKKCPYPNVPGNASITITGLYVNDNVSYSCNDGFKLYSGDLFRTCGRTRKWSGFVPTCIDQNLLLPLICPNTTGNYTSTWLSIEDLIRALTVARKDTNAYLRTITCADDQRISVRVIGWSGVFIVTIFISIFVIPDLLSLFKWLFLIVNKKQYYIKMKRNKKIQIYKSVRL